MLKSRKSQSGATLIECLVAIVVFALGMLGQASFMLTAMQNNQQSRYRAIASYYAEELIGMALADTTNRSSYAVSNSACTASSFTPCTQWMTRLLRDLPQAASGTSVNVSIDTTSTSATFGQMVVTIQWKGTNGNATQKFKSISNLNLITE